MFHIRVEKNKGNFPKERYNLLEKPVTFVTKSVPETEALLRATNWVAAYQYANHAKDNVWWRGGMSVNFNLEYSKYESALDKKTLKELKISSSKRALLLKMTSSYSPSLISTSSKSGRNFPSADEALVGSDTPAGNNDVCKRQISVSNN